ncbi:sensor histidine kinase [Lysinibacillus alkalisoli]|uniref:sensor histidine kinase n=1 Tax=Lysinibacillus alkalisoli TaxID=1911548 RepID=UPI00166B11A9
MKKWYMIIPSSPWLSIYLLIIFCLLPFFSIFKQAELFDIMMAGTLVVIYFIFNRCTAMSHGGRIYMWISFEMVVSLIMIIFFGYVYLAIFTAFSIGMIRRPVGFYIMYGLHVGFTVIATGVTFFFKWDVLLSQLPFIIFTIVGVVLMPFTLYTKNRREKLEGQLETAKDRIAELIVFEERQRIARDLHDTLGQKLSMIGLKSDLAARLIERDKDQALVEIKEIRQTASIALKEVRELVANMRTTRFEDELMRVAQILDAAEMDFTFEGDVETLQVPPLVENVLSMCLKEAITNVVKHSNATKCKVAFHQNFKEVYLLVHDNGNGLSTKQMRTGNGLKGMQERLEFINGSFKLESKDGTSLTITIPVALTHQHVTEKMDKIYKKGE